MAEEWGNHLVLYLYDADGSPVGMQYRNTSYAAGQFDTFWFEKNLQGDVVAVYNHSGIKLIAYTYDAWGNSSVSYYNSGASTTATYNPFRYRGYYLDSESGFYYLNSRYYDPAIGRFITADKFSTIKASSSELTDKNLYAYCDNNPVTRTDDGGTFWDTVFDVVSLVFSVAEVVANPASPGAWIGLAGDAIDLIPFVSGVGEIVRFARVADNTLEVVDTIHDAGRAADKAGDALEAGWKVGDDITKATKAGNAPSWSTVRSRYWKNEAHYNRSAYSDLNIQRMKQGKAPQFGSDGNMFSAELHHIVPRHKGGSNAYSNLLPVFPADHAIIDQYRYYG